MPKERFAKCNILDVLITTAHLFEKSSEIKIRTQFPAKPVFVFTDKEQMGRVFNNLIKNAIQAIPEDREGSVEIKVNVKKEFVFIEVADNGNGIDPAIKGNIFTPNFSTKTSGMGLGLAIARKTVETSGGKIYFKTRKDKGTSFIIELPLFKT
jgi:signal transduction histidine kinase